MHFKNYVIRILKIYLPLLMRRNNILLRVFKGYVDTVIFNKPVLKSIEFSVTTKCNSNCENCFAEYYRSPLKKELSVEEIRGVWSQAKKLGAIGSYLLGGEPTMRSDLFDILEVLEAKKYLVGIVTNSLLLTDKLMFQLKKSGLTFLSLSLDSMYEEENDRLRHCPGHYRKVLSAIKLAKKYNFRMDISCLLSHSTLPKIEEFIDFALKLGIDYIAPSVMIPVGKWVNNDKEILDENDWLRINKLIRKYPCLKFDFLQNLSGRQMCSGGIGKIAIGPYGDVMPCNVNPISFGNVHNEPLEVIWKRIQHFKFFKLGRNYKNCVVAADREYQKEVLCTISEIRNQPVFYLDHPNALERYF